MRHSRRAERGNEGGRQRASDHRGEHDRDDDLDEGEARFVGSANLPRQPARVHALTLHDRTYVVTVNGPPSGPVVWKLTWALTIDLSSGHLPAATSALRHDLNTTSFCSATAPAPVPAGVGTFVQSTWMLTEGSVSNVYVGSEPHDGKPVTGTPPAFSLRTRAIEFSMAASAAY